MARIVVDPVTRIEGHLRIEAQVEGGMISDAWSSGTMFRGIELILRGRDPREAWIWAQRICGVCTMVHALASVNAVEDALGIEVPDNARLVRNIIAATQTIQDHVIHFYHLHALDWVDVVSALKADPAKTSQLAQSISDWPMSSEKYFKGVQDRVSALVASKQLSLFGAGYWGHPAYRLPPEANLMAVAHYLEALQFQKEFIRIHAVLGGKNPHLQTFLVGGMATAMDPNEPGATINPERIDFLLQVAKSAIGFVNQVYIPDVLAVAGFYREWFELGAGVGNYMSYGGYPQGSIKDPANFFLPRGIILNRDLSKVHPVDPANVTEYVTHSWYEYSGGDQAAKASVRRRDQSEVFGTETSLRIPRGGSEVFLAEGSAVSGSSRWRSGRWRDCSLPTLRVSRTSRRWSMRRSAKLKAPPAALFSTLGRVAARALETQLLASRLVGWIEELGDNLASGNVRIHNGEKWDPNSWPKTAQGFGFFEAPRGSLGHWVEIEDQAIKNYQAVVPSTWNAGPRDARGQRGAV